MSATAQYPDQSLEAAFRATRYRVRSALGALEVRIGHRSECIDRLAEGKRWCIITAFNPRAKRVPARRNRVADQELEQRLRQRSPRVLLPALNRDPAGRWPDEPSWFSTFERDREVDRLAEAFDQAAVVIGSPGHPAELRFYPSTEQPGLGNLTE